MTDEEFFEMDPSWNFMTSSSDDELLFLKQLLISETQAHVMGVFVGNFFFNDKKANFVINRLNRLVKSEFIKIWSVNYDEFDEMVDSYDEIHGVKYNDIIQNDDDYSEIVFGYRIIKTKEFEAFLDMKLKNLQDDTIYNMLGEPSSKYSPEIIKLDYVTLPFQLQTDEIIKQINKYSSDYFQFMIEKQHKIDTFAVLLALEKNKSLKIINIFPKIKGKIRVDIERPKKINDKNDSSPVMIDNKSINNVLDELIVSGINITRSANENTALTWVDNEPLHNLLKSYQLWKGNVKNELDQNKIYRLIDTGVFYQGDGIPDFISGALYEHAYSIESQKLIKAIRIETEKQLDYLRKAKSDIFNLYRLENKELNDKNNIKNEAEFILHTNENIELRFNKETGGIVFGEIKDNIPFGTNEYNIFLFLLNSPSYKAEYKQLLRIMYPNKDFLKPLKEYQTDVWALNTTIRNIKKKLGILPMKNRKNQDIFQTLKNAKSYRLELN